MNRKGSNQGHVVCSHSLMDSDFVDWWDCSPRFQDSEDAQICQTYIVSDILLCFKIEM